MANVNSKQDDNQVFTLVGLSGTLGPTYGTAQARPITVTEDGKINVNSSASLTVGTIDRVNTIGTLEVGSITASLALNTGTITTIQGGTVQVSAGTVVGTFLEVTGSATAGTTDLIASMDVSSYKWGAVQITNTWVGSINVQMSNDNTNFVLGNTYRVTQTQNTGVGNIVVNDIYYFPVNSRYLRVRMNAFTSGTAQAVMELYSLPGALTTMGVSATLVSSGTLLNLASGTLAALASGTISVGTVTGDVASGATDSGNPVKAGAKFNNVLPTFTDGQRGDLQIGSRGAVRAELWVPSSASSLAVGADNADGVATSATGNRLFTNSRNFVFNGGSFDRMPGDTNGVWTVPARVGTDLNTIGTTGAAVWGTLVAASGAGTKQYVSGLDIVVTSGTVDVAVTNIGVGGSTGAGVLARGQFPAGGGVAKQFNPLSVSGTNGTLSYWLGGAGTVSINIHYWQGV